jgi:hypothetical protein
MLDVKQQTQKRIVARGTQDPRFPGRLQVVVSFDHDDFEVIRQRAIAQNTSFAEQVRILVEWGLEADA